MNLIADIRLDGRRGVENGCAAATAAPAAFAGLPHRTTLLAEVDGVRNVDEPNEPNGGSGAG